MRSACGETAFRRRAGRRALSVQNRSSPQAAILASELERKLARSSDRKECNFMARPLGRFRLKRRGKSRFFKDLPLFGNWPCALRPIRGEMSQSDDRMMPTMNATQGDVVNPRFPTRCERKTQSQIPTGWRLLARASRCATPLQWRLSARLPSQPPRRQFL